MDKNFTYFSQENTTFFLEDIKKKRLPIFTITIYQHDKKLCEEAFDGHTTSELNHMFSIAKTITALSILHMDATGIISVNDTICSFFPEKVTTPYPQTMAMTIKDMLMMRTVHSKSAYRSDCLDDWCGHFFTTPPSHDSGTEFSYDTSGAHVLSALVEKKTGMPPIEYFKKHFSSVGFSKESYSMEGPDGYHMGGTGLMATAEDILKLGIFLLAAYRLDTDSFCKQYNICEKMHSHILTASSFLTDSAPKAKDHFDSFGYGLMIWRTDNNGFMLYGLGGQFVCVYPEHELILVTTADTQKHKGANDELFNSFYNSFF